MNYIERRKRIRAVLDRGKCIQPASVFDPLSARIAQTVGYELGMLAGSVASNTSLAAPDLSVLTLTEFADQIRRMMRVSSLSLLVDADHGYGNALNVMRTVEECEHAGVSALTIEDTVLPNRFGQDKPQLITTDEMVGKLRAALAARRDPELVIIGRTSALRIEDTKRAVARAKTYAATGVDAIFVVGPKTLEQINDIHSACKLPLVLGGPPASLSNEDMAASGARIKIAGHHPVAATVKALRETYMHLFNGGAAADLKPKIASTDEMASLVDEDSYKKWMREYLR